MLFLCMIFYQKRALNKEYNTKGKRLPNLQNQDKWRYLFQGEGIVIQPITSILERILSNTELTASPGPCIGSLFWYMTGTMPSDNEFCVGNCNKGEENRITTDPFSLFIWVCLSKKKNKKKEGQEDKNSQNKQLTGRQLMKNSYLCWSSACSKLINLKTAPSGDKNLLTAVNSLLSLERFLSPQSVLPE